MLIPIVPVIPLLETHTTDMMPRCTKRKNKDVQCSLNVQFTLMSISHIPRAHWQQAQIRKNNEGESYLRILKE